MRMIRLAAVGCVIGAVLTAEAKVVINEISYHPPEDNEALEFIELFNSAEGAVDLSGWKFTKGIKYEFAKGMEIPGNGFVVLARDREAFKKVYGAEPAGVFASTLKNSGENLELSDAQGNRVDKVSFKDDAPWPLSADGETATLERISPGAESDTAANWASSPLSRDAGKPAGTPGKQNANYAAVLPPVISEVTFEPRQPAPGQAVKVSAVVRDGTELGAVELVFRAAASGSQKAEERAVMKADGGNRFSAAIPAQPENSLVRFRVEAVNRSGSRRLEPGANEPLPAFSYFVHEKFSPGKIGRGLIVHVDAGDFKKAQRHRSGGTGAGMSPADQERFGARMAFETGTDFSAMWTELCLTQQLSHAQLMTIREPARTRLKEREEALEELDASDEPMREARELALAFHGKLHEGFQPALDEPQRAALERWQKGKTNRIGQQMWTPETLLQRLCNVEGPLLYASTRGEVSESAFEEMKTLCARFMGERQKLVSMVMAAMQGKGDREEAQKKMEALNSEVDKAFGALLADETARREYVEWRENNNPFQMRPPGAGSKKAETRARGVNAFVFVPAEGGAAEVYDFVEVRPRGGGYKVHFAKRRPFREMSAINLIFEYNERFVLAEALAYEVYRRAGNAASKTDFVRLEVDGRPWGYHLLVEQPNRAFLKRNKLRDDGNLYKILWYERGAVRQHEKKTNLETGHDDLLAVLEALEKSAGDEEWAVIKKHFNVEQVINYFAVNMVLSHWDGYFNNYFTYHDAHGTGKWEMYPWDQDKTWGFHDGLGGEIFYDMPVTFGMEGDKPPGHPKDRPAPQGFNGGHWWRAGGYFSKPLLANPEFRKHFLARTREILETVYSEKEFFPAIDGLTEQLTEEVRVRAEVMKENPEEAMGRFERNLESLKEHLTKRREFLLAQDEIKAAGKFERAALK